jgi:hypothetical protein
VKILTCFFFSIHFALFIILNNLDVHNSCVQMLATSQGCFVDLHINFLDFAVSDTNLLPHHFSYFFYGNTWASSIIKCIMFFSHLIFTITIIIIIFNYEFNKY